MSKEFEDLPVEDMTEAVMKVVSKHNKLLFDSAFKIGLAYAAGLAESVGNSHFDTFAQMLLTKKNGILAEYKQRFDQ